jgi:hypothetical protein
MKTIYDQDLPHVTVRQLIEQLQKFPEDAAVLVEGCDCIGPCSGATLPAPAEAKMVLITRSAP